MSEVRHVEQLPREKHRDGWIVTHGYAVRLAWEPITDNPGRDWFFFRQLEPAWLFLRTARMGQHTAEGDVYSAAREIRFSERHGDVKTLHIGDAVNYWDINEPALAAYFVGQQLNQDTKFPAAPGQPPSAYPRTPTD